MWVKVPDLNDLHLLVAIARTGSIGQAASELGLAQPSASRRIAVLERTLRLNLLRRGTRGSTLTPSGRVVVDWANTLLSAVDEFRHSVEALGHERSSMLRAGVSMTVGEHYAPSWLALVRYQSPDTVVSLSVANSSEVMDMVESGSVDVGVVETPRVRPTLKHRRIGVDRLAVAVAPDHPWAAVESVSAAELASTPLLIREQGSGTRDTLEQAMTSAGHEITPALELASNTALKSAAIAGMGPVILAAVALANDFERRTLIEVKLADLSLARPLTIVWTDATRLSEEALGLFVKAAKLDPRTRDSRSAGIRA